MYCDPYDWNDFIKYTKVRKTVIFGAGYSARRFIAAYALSEDGLNISFIIDNNSKLWGTNLYDIPIYHISRLKELNPDDVVILICGPEHSMAYELRTMGYSCFHYQNHIEKNRHIEEAVLNRYTKCKYSFDYSWAKKVNHRYVHALGVLDGYMYTNSLEAFENSYKMGYRAFEADICRIEDGSLLLCHKINSICTVDSGIVNSSKNLCNSLSSSGRPWSIERYKEERVFGKYTPMTTMDFIKLMKKYPDIYWITHTYHNYSKDILSIFSQLKNEADDTSILDRFIIQVYDEYMLDIAMSVYPFKCASLLQYMYLENAQTYNNNIYVCLKTGIKMVTLPVSRLNREVVGHFNTYGIDICAYGGIYTEKDLEYYRDMGAELFCID